MEVAPSMRGLLWFTNKTVGFLGCVTKPRPKTRHGGDGIQERREASRRGTRDVITGLASERSKNAVDVCLLDRNVHYLTKLPLRGVCSFYVAGVVWSFASIARLHIYIYIYIHYTLVWNNIVYPSQQIPQPRTHESRSGSPVLLVARLSAVPPGPHGSGTARRGFELITSFIPSLGSPAALFLDLVATQAAPAAVALLLLVAT
jgi:hypothetical protein